ncbi:MAG: alpha/beta fold hydrolase [Candidatus Binatia bacterium]
MILIVHGYDGSGPGHWQRWLAAELARRDVPVAFPELPSPTAPDRDAWVSALAAEIAAAGGEPVTLVCHSLGCWAADHLVATYGARGLHGALLAAPPSPALLFEPVESFLPPPRRRDAWAPIAERTLLVGSDDDPYTALDEFEVLAAALGIPFRQEPGAGHVNVESGHGPWPFVLDWLVEVGAIDRAKR